MANKLNWIYEGEAGFWHSADGRFEISPKFRHTVNPDSYSLRDNVAGTRQTEDTVRGAKQHAARILANLQRAAQ